jgi:hypothetical protein
MSCLRLAAQAMRIQLNVSGRTVIELTPAMTEHFAARDAAAHELAQKPTASVPHPSFLARTNRVASIASMARALLPATCPGSRTPREISSQFNFSQGSRSPSPEIPEGFSVPGCPVTGGETKQSEAPEQISADFSSEHSRDDQALHHAGTRYQMVRASRNSLEEGWRKKKIAGRSPRF